MLIIGATIFARNHHVALDVIKNTPLGSPTLQRLRSSEGRQVTKRHHKRDASQPYLTRSGTTAGRSRSDTTNVMFDLVLLIDFSIFFSLALGYTINANIWFFPKLSRLPLCIDIPMRPLPSHVMSRRRLHTKLRTFPWIGEVAWMQCRDRIVAFSCFAIRVTTDLHVLHCAAESGGLQHRRHNVRWFLSKLCIHILV